MGEVMRNFQLGMYFSYVLGLLYSIVLFGVVPEILGKRLSCIG